MRKKHLKHVGQVTIAKPVSIKGVGLHSGKEVTLTLQPAEEYTGIVFHRTDETTGANAILVNVDAVHQTDLCTEIKNDHGVTVKTVEHLMAALHGLGVDNIIIELNGEEVPILDGSAEPFVELIDDAGRMRQDDAKKSIQVLKTVEVKEGKCLARVFPSDKFSVEIKTDYNHPLLPEQVTQYILTEDSFRDDISEARTFCFEKDLQMMRDRGLIKGGSLDNAVVIGEKGILNDNPLRMDNELINHKILDCIGDFYMAGYPILGDFYLEYPGHEMNNRLLKALLADKDAWQWVG
jgi:UDP-3-O-[3-hydroxymyristoyl] N-acetylglucosamine deacetylase